MGTGAVCGCCLRLRLKETNGERVCFFVASTGEVKKVDMVKGAGEAAVKNNGAGSSAGAISITFWSGCGFPKTRLRFKVR